MLYKDVPFLRFTLPVAAGILIRYLSDLVPLYLSALVLAALLAACLLSFRNYPASPFFGALVFVFFLLAGYLLYDCKYIKINSFVAEPRSYLVRVEKLPVTREKSIKIPGTVMREGESKRALARMMIYLPPGSGADKLLPGDLVNMELNPELISDYEPNDNFNYAKYMLHNGYRYTSFASSFTNTGSRAAGIRHRAILIQNSLREKYLLGIHDRRSVAIISALTLGYRDDLDDEIREKFTGAGISHIMAVSGLHVGIILVIVSSLLGLGRIRSGPVYLAVTILALWSFALISGLSPSVCRASLMLSFIITGKCLDRHIRPLNSLLASAFILLLIDPFILFSVSFQLSYSAVLGILLFYKKAERVLNFSGLLLQKTWSLVVLTIVAQSGSLPFVLYHFRSVPLLSVLSNVFAIPLAFLIIISGILLLLTPSSLFLFDWLSSLVETETRLLYSIADWVSSL